MDTYIYKIDNNLYINLTNKCNNNCVFCVRNGKEDYFGNKLWLTEEPTVKQILELIAAEKKFFNEVVFCGFGEPTYKLNILIEIGKALKQKNIKVRLNTNGCGNLINNKNIAPLLKKSVDIISISLNASNAEDYQKLCKSGFGLKTFDSILEFAKNCKDEKIITVFTIVNTGNEKLEECKKIADGLGIELRVRELIE